MPGLLSTFSIVICVCLTREESPFERDSKDTLSSSSLSSLIHHQFLVCLNNEETRGTHTRLSEWRDLKWVEFWSFERLLFGKPRVKIERMYRTEWRESDFEVDSLASLFQNDKMITLREWWCPSRVSMFASRRVSRLFLQLNGFSAYSANLQLSSWDDIQESTEDDDHFVPRDRSVSDGLLSKRDGKHRFFIPETI